MPNDSQTVHVLVVSNVADPLAEILRLRGYDAVAARDVEEALTVSEGCRPEAVIAEVVSKRVADGLQGATELAEAFIGCKLILFAKNFEKASQFLRSHATDNRFVLVRRPKLLADIAPFIAAIDAMVM